jgi:hypothetical protein
MFNWIQELETLQPEIEKDKVISLSDHRIRTLQSLCKLPLYQVAMVALYCTMRKAGKQVRSNEFLAAARKALPGKPVVAGLEALITANWMRVSPDGIHHNDDMLRITPPVEHALQVSDFHALPPAKHDDPHWHLRRLYARACAFRRGQRTAHDWALFCEDYVRHMKPPQRRMLREAGWSQSVRDIAFYTATISMVEGGDLDIRAVLYLFAPDPIERAVLRSHITHADFPLMRDGWWTMEDSFRGDLMLSMNDRLVRLFIPDLKVNDAKQIHRALNTISYDRIEPVKLVYDETLRGELDTLTKLCDPKTFHSYTQSYGHAVLRGLVVQLHGAPGTGKTEFCYQLARQTGRDVLVLDVAQARDKYYGETEKIISGIFREYEKRVIPHEPFPILLFNEGDSIFQRRVSNDRESSPTENTVQTILLNELERFQGILLVTTNTPYHFDKAFERRFQFRLQFNAPGEQARLQLLRDALPESNESVLERMAAECIFTAAELQNALRKMHIEQLCGKCIHDRAATLEQLLCSHRSVKRAIGFRL